MWILVWWDSLIYEYTVFTFTSAVKDSALLDIVWHWRRNTILFWLAQPEQNCNVPLKQGQKSGPFPIFMTLEYLFCQFLTVNNEHF